MSDERDKSAGEAPSDQATGTVAERVIMPAPEPLTCEAAQELMDGYLDGELESACVERLLHHSSECESCSGALEELAALLRFARTLNSRPIPLAVADRLRQALNRESGLQLPLRTPRLTIVRDGDE